MQPIFAGKSDAARCTRANHAKTLDQIETRTPISSLPFAIITPGSYYLTKSLNVTTGDAITITASQGTLDLNRISLISSTANPAAGIGIVLPGPNADITILNGHIKGGVINSGGTFSGSGFATGINSPTFLPRNVRVVGLSVSGCMSDGIRLFTGSSTLGRILHNRTGRRNRHRG